MNDFDELVEDLSTEEEFEEVCRGAHKYPFPAINVDERFFTFNEASWPLVKEYKAVRYYLSKNLVAMMPCRKGSVNSFVFKIKSGMTIPTALQEYKIRPGWYKLYRYKDGVAFKRYEPIELKQRGKS